MAKLTRREGELLLAELRAEQRIVDEMVRRAQLAALETLARR